MLDVHSRLYGSKSIYILGVPAYSFFVGLGIIAGLIYYFISLKKEGKVSEGAVKIVFSAIIFGTIGSKVPLLLEGRSFVEILYGKSIVGGLIGGMFGVIAIKKVLGIKLKLGNFIAPSVALGMVIGRLGCFFNGCCYGIVAPWGYNFGDGLLRIPTQLFESAFNLIAFILLVYFKNKVKTPGILFKIYLISYFIFRFFIEFIRENSIIFVGLTIYQIICFIGLIYISIILWKVQKNGREQSI